MKNAIFLFLMLISATIVFGQKKELQSITENELKAHLQFLSSDLMQGRDYRTSGLQIAAEYLKSECLKIGLKPVSPNYAQPVKMKHIQFDTTKTMIILKKGDGTIAFKSSDIVTNSSSSKNDTLNAKIIFAGYGWINKDKGYNDLEGFDLKGKIVMIMTRNPELANEKSANQNESRSERRIKLENIFKAGALAVLLVADPMDTDKSSYNKLRQVFMNGIYQAEGQQGDSGIFAGNLLFSGIESANAILKETGKTLEQIQKEINNTMKPASLELQNISASIIISKKTETIITENVIGVVEGSDPVLKNECVVFTAHYDHLGVNAKGQVFNGADDNGSGTVALLEVAEAIMKMDKRTKRSIVFAWVTGEEKGMSGSYTYVEHPPFPIEKTLSNINLDMVGRSAKKIPKILMI